LIGRASAASESAKAFLLAAFALRRGMANTLKRTPKRTVAILAELSDGKSVAAACRSAGIGRSTYYEWRDEDAEFRALTDAAIEDGTDALEDHAHERAKDKNNPSDTLTIFLLKARRPDKFRDNQTIRHEGHDGGPLAVSVVRIHEPEPS
jgi:transposase-like protein